MSIARWVILLGIPAGLHAEVTFTLDIGEPGIVRPLAVARIGTEPNRKATPETCRRLEVIGKFDNSANNPLNPDPKTAVRWGAASENEMMDGWIEYVDAAPLRRSPGQAN